MHKSLIVFLLALVAMPVADANEKQPSPSEGDRLLAEYFADETAKLSDATFADITTLEDWTQHREQYRQELEEMLGLDPMPPRTDLHPVITGTVKEDEFTVEKLHFQSMPGLYVTANLYRPKEVTEPLPAILYVCGHGRVKKDGISYGNKTHYQYHGAWFARNGYVCLTIDTIQLGEIEGMHHGTYSHDKWWWNNRGYTPAGVEAWNCIRALDYLQSRKEVDPDRIGVTGRSGGGAYSWWIAALDERIKAAVPVAGITNLHNHVVDGCVEGHCDCMYMVNTYRWDYAKVAALVAPRPLLISNTDKDRIFPLEGVVDVHHDVRRIYELYDAGSKLGLQITEGPHRDTQELRIHAFRWFNRHLKKDNALIEDTATPFFEPAELKVFDEIPADERVTTIDETFVSKADPNQLPDTKQELRTEGKQWLKALREKCFRGWPDSDSQSLDVKVVEETKRDDCRIQTVQYTSQSPYRLSLYVLDPSAGQSNSTDAKNASAPVTIRVLDQTGWDEVAPALSFVLPDSIANPSGDENAWTKLRKSLPVGPTVFIAPRGVGLTQWSTDKKTQTHIRRRFMLLGQTAASMQVYDLRRALAALVQVDSLKGHDWQLSGDGESAVWALYASLFDERVSKLTLTNLPSTNRDAPDILNVSRYVEMPELVMLAAERVKELVLQGSSEVTDKWQKVNFPDFCKHLEIVTDKPAG